MQGPVWFAWLCRFVGLLRTLLWAAGLYLAATPWRDLGGLIDERTRWLGWFVLYGALVIGFALGDYLQEACPPRNMREQLRRIHRMLALPAALTAAWLIVLRTLGRVDAACVVFCGFLSYWAGIDIGTGAMPLLRGAPFGSEGGAGDSAHPSGTGPPWES